MCSEGGWATATGVDTYDSIYEDPVNFLSTYDMPSYTYHLRYTINPQVSSQKYKNINVFK